MKRRSQSHIPNCALCCSKSSAADTQWKIPDMCVRGCRIASMWFNYKDERRLALGTTWCKVNLYFVRSCFILYRILCIWHLHVHGDQITTNIQSTWQYLCIFSAVLARLCKFYALPIVVYIRQSAMDALVGSVREFPLTMVSIGAHWIWTALSQRSWFSPRLKKSLDYNVRPAARVSRRYLPQPARVFNC